MCIVRGDFMHDKLSNDSLLIELHTAICATNRSEAALLSLMGEVDARKLFVGMAYPSLYSFCVEELHLSEAAARKRVTAAKCARTFPVLLDHVASGALHLCGITLLAPHLSRDNADALIAASLFQSKRKIELMLAARFGEEALLTCAPGRIEAIGAGRYRLKATITETQRERLEYARALLSHRMPGASIEAVLDVAIETLIATEEKRLGIAAAAKSEQVVAVFSTAAQTPTPHSPPNSRHIPMVVRRAVLARDGHQCTYADERGRRCAATHFLELDHIQPFALGGAHTVDNLRLRCRSHNGAHAREVFGASFMSQWLE